MNTLRRSLSDLALGDTVTVLDVSYGNHKSLPKKITKMKNLETLNASGNDIDEVIFAHG
jgi:Leucine-rich repeat (LRR) protein